MDLLIKARFVEIFGDTALNPFELRSVALEGIADIVSGITKGRKTKEQNLIEVPYMAVSNVKTDILTGLLLRLFRQQIQKLSNIVYCQTMC